MSRRKHWFGERLFTDVRGSEPLPPLLHVLLPGGAVLVANGEL